MILRAAFATLVLSVLLALGIWMSGGEITRAEESTEWVQTYPEWQKFSGLKEAKQLDLGIGAWMYGGSVNFSKYDLKESMYWFADFVLDPERAANRKVMHLYDMNAIPQEMLGKLFKTAMAADFTGNMALVSYAPKTKSFIGLPIAYKAYDHDDIKASSNVPSDLELRAFILEGMNAGMWKARDVVFSDTIFLAVDKPIEVANIEAESFVTDTRAWPTSRSEER